MRHRWVRFFSLLVGLLLVFSLSGALRAFAYGEEWPIYEPVVLKEGFAPLPLEGTAPFSPKENGFLAGGAGYQDDSLNIRVKTLRAYETDIMAVFVQIADPSQLRTELAKPYPSKTTARADVLAKRAKAVLAVNGDYFTYHNAGVIYRQGKLLRDRPNHEYDGLIIDENGDFFIMSPIVKEAYEAFPRKILHSFCFGPGLVVDGVACQQFHLLGQAPEKPTQRMGIAQLGPLTYLLVSTEGPENKGSVGLTLPEFAGLLVALGAKTAYNLDGGSSSSVILHDQKINALSSGKIRPIGDILYFATAVPEEE